MAKRLVNIANNFSVKIKQHNADYLSPERLTFLNKIGVHSINVAPEFGVWETRFILNELKKYSLERDRNNFIRYSIDSKKWMKWAFEHKKYDNNFLAELSGHYLFSTASFQSIFKKIKKFNPRLEEVIISEHELRIREILTALGYSFLS